MIGSQAVDDQDEDVQLAVLATSAAVVVGAAAGRGQEGSTGGAGGTGLQQPPAAQARIHAAGE
jgi:hypothetical protein